MRNDVFMLQRFYVVEKYSLLVVLLATTGTTKASIILLQDILEDEKEFDPHFLQVLFSLWHE